MAGPPGECFVLGGALTTKSRPLDKAGYRVATGGEERMQRGRLGHARADGSGSDRKSSE
jgi:hypothetical protein